MSCYAFTSTVLYAKTGACHVQKAAAPHGRMGSRFQIIRSEGIAKTVPDAQYADMLLRFPDVKNDAVDSPAFAIQQLPGRKAKLAGFRNKRATSGVSSGVGMAANKPTSHFSAYMGAASRMRSNAAEASASARAERLTP
jgi:hypothetical protein